MQQEAALRTTVGMSEALKGGARRPRQILSDQYTLSQPEGRMCLPITTQQPPDFKTFRQPWTEVYRSAYYLPEST